MRCNGGTWLEYFSSSDVDTYHLGNLRLKCRFWFGSLACGLRLVLSSINTADPCAVLGNSLGVRISTKQAKGEILRKEVAMV